MNVVSRRTFLKAAAAVIWAPKIELRPAIDREKIMLAFCDPFDERYHIGSPFAVNSLTYATDRYAMIRAELANRSELEDRRIPNVTPVWNDLWHPRSWHAFDPALLTPKYMSEGPQLCPQCGAARISLGEEYPDMADGDEIQRIYSLGYDVDDNTIRDPSCSLCKGLEFSGPDVSDLLGCYHSTFFVKRIAAIPDVQISRSCADGDVLLFRGDGFEGVSLGIDRKYVTKGEDS